MFPNQQSILAGSILCEISHIEVGNIPDFRATFPCLVKVLPHNHWHIDCVSILLLRKT